MQKNTNMKWWVGPVLASVAAVLLVQFGDVHFLLAAAIAGILTGGVFRWGARKEREQETEA